MNHSCWVTSDWADFRGLTWRRVQCPLIPVTSCSLDVSGHVSIVFRGHSRCFTGFRWIQQLLLAGGAFRVDRWNTGDSGQTSKHRFVIHLLCNLKVPQMFWRLHTCWVLSLKGEWDSLFYTMPFLKHNNCAGFKNFKKVIFKSVTSLEVTNSLVSNNLSVRTPGWLWTVQRQKPQDPTVLDQISNSKRGFFFFLAKHILVSALPFASLCDALWGLQGSSTVSFVSEAKKYKEIRVHLLSLHRLAAGNRWKLHQDWFTPLNCCSGDC